MTGYLSYNTMETYKKKGGEVNMWLLIMGGIYCIIGIIAGIIFGNLFNICALIFYGLAAFSFYYAIQESNQIKYNETKEKLIEESTEQISKFIYKGQVISKDKSSNTYSTANNTVRTVHIYKTSVRLYDDSNNSHIIYFDDERTYMSCMEGEYVGVLIISNLDKEGNTLSREFLFMGNYKPFQDEKNRYLTAMGCPGGDGLGVTIENIPYNGYIIK